MGFLLKVLKMMYYQMTTNSAVSRDLGPVTNNWNNFSKYLWTNKFKYHIYIFAESTSY